MSYNKLKIKCNHDFFERVIYKYMYATNDDTTKYQDDIPFSRNFSRIFPRVKKKIYIDWYFEWKLKEKINTISTVKILITVKTICKSLKMTFLSYYNTCMSLIGSLFLFNLANQVWLRGLSTICK